MPEGMENEFMKRGYLLPEGCKDLIDVLRPARTSFVHDFLPQKPLLELTVPAQMTVRELAEALGHKPFMIIADLLKIGVFATAWQQLSFDVISRIARKYGFLANKQ